MLESSAHQGMNLHINAQSRQLRVLGVMPGGDPYGVESLWAAFAQLQHLGYPVVVLNAFEQETPSAPGLQDLMQPQSGVNYVALPVGNEGPHSVATLPAARGALQALHRAKQQGCRPIDLLHRYLRNHALVVIVAPEQLLSPVMKSATQAPLLLVPEHGRSLLRSYRALKHMLMHGGHTAKLVTMTSASGFTKNLQSVVQCAMHHLHVEPLVMQFNPDNPRQLQRWSLQCLEQAEPVGVPQAAVQPTEWSH